MLVSLLVVLIVALIVLVVVGILPLDARGKQIAYGIAAVILLIMLILVVTGNMTVAT